MRTVTAGLIFSMLLAAFPACSPDHGPACGEIIPDFTYKAADGELRTAVPKDRELLIILFSCSCSCRSRIHYLNSRTAELKDLDLLLVTEDRDLFSSPEYLSWNNLRRSPDVEFGIIEQGIRQNLFHVEAPLHACLYNADGHLIRNLGKEVMIERINRIRLRHSTENERVNNERT